MLLAKHYWYTGQYHRIWPLAERIAPVLEKAGVLPYARLIWQLVLIYDAWARTDPKRGLQVAEQALILS
jgi:hypothetical protein